MSDSVSNNFGVKAASVSNAAPVSQNKTSVVKGWMNFFSAIVAQLKKALPFISVIPSPQQENSLPVKQVNDLKIHELQVCINTLDNLEKSLGETCDRESLVSLRSELQRELTSERMRKNGSLAGIENQDAKADKAYILSEKALIPDTINKLAISLKAADPTLSGTSIKEIKKAVKAEFKQANINHLNNADWKTVTAQFSHNDQTFTSVLTPAAQMQSAGRNIFTTDYNGKGVCSADQKNTTHAANLWSSTFSVMGEDGKPVTLFEGVRHGVNSPYLLAKGSDERKSGAENRAREVVTAALFLDMNREILNSALKGDTVTLRLASTSLLAPSDILGSKEGSQLADQVNAWQALSSEKPLKLSIPGPNGEFITVNIDFKVAAFNFPVNERGLNLGFGMKKSEEVNQAGLRILLGNTALKAELGGWVGLYLAGDPEPRNAEVVRALATQLKTMLADKSYRSDGGDPYKPSRTLSLLAFEIGATPAWNCKSGKDRTGTQDAEIKFASVLMHQSKDRLPHAPGKLSAANQELLGKTSIYSGNDLVQQYAAGAPGNKTFGTSILRSLIGTSVRMRVGGKWIAEQIRGLSDRV